MKGSAVRGVAASKMASAKNNVAGFYSGDMA
jgi:hypothetical protein